MNRLVKLKVGLFLDVKTTRQAYNTDLDYDEDVDAAAGADDDDDDVAEFSNA